MHNFPIHRASLGFSGPDDEVVSLNVPAAAEDGKEHPSYSFDIEYDPEHPDRLTICLLELDQDNFIHTVRKSVPFPVGLLTELISKRKATAEEVAAWQTTPDGEE
ncbi:MAG TPA: hypothetical protein VEZ16_01440 [Microvirga sp.]|nr:hypothetical protein [Microvirga sp.]